MSAKPKPMTLYEIAYDLFNKAKGPPTHEDVHKALQSAAHAAHAAAVEQTRREYEEKVERVRAETVKSCSAIDAAICDAMAAYAALHRAAAAIRSQPTAPEHAPTTCPDCTAAYARGYEIGKAHAIQPPPWTCEICGKTHDEPWCRYPATFTPAGPLLSKPPATGKESAK